MDERDGRAGSMRDARGMAPAHAENTPTVVTGTDRSSGTIVRGLAGTLLALVATWRAVGAVVGRVVGVVSTGRGPLGRWISRGRRVMGGVVRAVGHVLAPLWSGAARCGSAAAAVLGPVGRWLAAPVRGLGRTALVVVRPVVRLGRTMASVGARAVRWAAGQVARVSRVAARTFRVGATVVGSMLAFLVRPVAWVVRRATALGVPGVRASARATARGTMALARVVTSGARLVAHGVGVVIGVVVPVVVRCVRWALVPFRSVGRGLARTARVVAVPLGGAARLVGSVLRPPARGVSGAVTAAAGAASRLIEAIGTRLDRMAAGSLVAVGTARHRAGRRPGSATQALQHQDPAPVDHRRSVVDPGRLASAFEVDCRQNEHLAPGGSEVEGILSVAADLGSLHDCTPDFVEVFLLDCSTSMGYPWEKIRALRAATVAALDCLPDGAWFAVVRGADSAEVAYPPDGGLAEASDVTRGEAARAVVRLQPDGGTAIGRWLDTASQLMALRPGAIHHAILLTDGKDEDETARELDAAVAACAGRVQVDCRGVGSDWDVGELRGIASALLGTVDIIRAPDQMEDDFRAMVAAAMARLVEAGLRIWVPEGARIVSFRQVAPAIEDLGARAGRVDPHTVEVPTGAWTTERRAYHLRIAVPPGPVGDEVLAARVSVVVAGQLLARALVRATWTEDRALAARIDPEVAHYTGQVELARAVRQGLDAWRSGDEGRAVERLGRAVQLAADSGSADTGRLLADVVHVEDARTGTVRLRTDAEVADVLALDVRSTRTVRSTTPVRA